MLTRPPMRVSLRHQTTILTTFSTFFHFAESVLVNATIDDTIPDPFSGATVSYSPAEAWNDGPSCTVCTAHPDPAQVISGTWHDSTFNSQPGSNDFPNSPLFATTTFSGVAVYVICALAQSTDHPSGNSDMTFFIDNALVGTFELPAPGGTGYTYRVPVYANSSLEPGQHQITIQNGQVNGQNSLVLLDAIVYSFDQDLSQPQPSQNTPSNPSNTASQQSVSASSSRQQSSGSHPTEISSQVSVKPILSRGVMVGLVLGGLCLLGVIGPLIYWWRRRQRRLSRAADTLDTLPATPTRPTVIPTPFAFRPSCPPQDGGEDSQERKRAGRSADTSLSTQWQGDNHSGFTPVAGPSTESAGSRHQEASFNSSMSATTSDSFRPLISVSGHQPLASQNYLPDGTNSDTSTMSLLTPPPAYYPGEGSRNTHPDLDLAIDISPQAVGLD